MRKIIGIGGKRIKKGVKRVNRRKTDETGEKMRRKGF
jgi:hypothetical protein